jgi:hypothetical protein
MKQDSLYQKLIRAARWHRPDDHVPYAFEKRIMARLSLSPQARDEWAAITRALWCSAGACCAIALAISIWAFGFESALDSTASFSNELEQTILASINDFKLDFDVDMTEGDLEILQ